MEKVWNYMRKSISILIAVFTLIFANTEAQEEISFKYIDSLTYDLYLNKNWKELTKASRNSIKKDIDYYYLRMRAGIAFYERKKYFRASHNFFKAYLFNNMDDTPPKYLFYSSLLTGNKDEAKFLYHKYSVSDSPIKEASLKKISVIGLNSGFSMNSVKNPYSIIIPESPLNIDGYQNVTKSTLINNINLKHDINHNLFFSHNLGIVSRLDYYLNSIAGEASVSDVTRLIQTQYYASMKYFPARNISLTTSLHFIRYSLADIEYKSLASGNYYTVNGKNQGQQVGDFSAFYSLGQIKTGLGISVHNLGGKNHFQQNYSLVTYPFGNLSFYTISVVHLINDQLRISMKDNNILFRNTLGLKVYEHLWLESSLWKGEFKNAAINEGLLIFNGLETIKTNFNINLLIPLNKVHFTLFFSNMKYYTSLHTFSEIDTGENKKYFDNFSYLISSKWIF
jgi:hypothetical protein